MFSKKRFCSPFLRKRLFFSKKQKVSFSLTRIAIGIGAIFILILFFFAGKDIQKGVLLSRDDVEFPVIILDRNGKEIHRSFVAENRQWVDLSNIPEFLREATVVAEDRRFYFHFGVDIVGIFRAMWINFREGDRGQGASTISQQIARKVFLSDEKTISRKVREMLIAVGIELGRSKVDIPK